MKENNSYAQFLKQENELTKLKIQAEFGFQVAGESSLNPALENIWLKQILDYERSMVNNKKITVGEKIGHPLFKPLTELKSGQVQTELHNVMEALHQKNIVVDVLAEVSDEDLYKFITEELMSVETDSNTPPNMLTCFIYEEFHPNHEYDIRNRGQEFMNALESRDVDFSFVIDRESTGEIHEIRFEKLKRRLNLFREAFENVEIKMYEIKSIEINMEAESAEVNFSFHLSVTPVESKSNYSIKGDGKFVLNYSYEWWSIVDVEMKGVTG